MAQPHYDLTHQQIQQLAARAYDQVLSLVDSGVSPRQAVEQALSGFSGELYDVMAAEMSRTLSAAIGSDEIRKWPVRDTTLSNALYQDARGVSAAVSKIIKDHAQWKHSVRSLALELYEGYNFREREVIKPLVGLPKYMRNAAAEADITALLARMQTSQLKTAALKAAYDQALDRILQGAGEEAIRNALWVAVQEKYRYLANRIAQTELHRAHTAQRAQELLNWDELEVVEYRLSPSHPRPDICDVYAFQDAYGLGPGRYPKHSCPAPPIHPHCRCVLAPILGVKANKAKPNPRAAASFMRGLDPKIAHQVAGSHQRVQDLLNGANPSELFSQGRPADYRIGTLQELLKQMESLI